MSRVLGALAFTLVLCACATSGRSASAGASPVTSPRASPGASPTLVVAPAPSGTTLIRDGFLVGGTTYATSTFAERFTITVPADLPVNFWLATSTSLTRTIEFGNPQAEGAGVTFYLPTGAYDANGSAAPVPTDFVTWLQQNPHLTVSLPKSVTVGGKPATELDLTVKTETITQPSGLCQGGEKCVLVASTAPEASVRPLLIHPGDATKVLVVNLPGRQMLIAFIPGAAIQPQAERLVATLQFVP
jgi:hypothetical protein